MENENKELEALILKRLSETEKVGNYGKFGLSHNPFPRAGISDINSSEYLVSRLRPVDEEVEKAIVNYVFDSVFAVNERSEDKYMSIVIRGDYGSGKTQTLLYIKYILESLAELKISDKKPYVVYIDNPGVKLSELIGALIYQIGEESFKKYLWNVTLDKIPESTNFKEEINKILRSELFTQQTDIFNETNLISYRAFLDAVYNNLSPQKRKDFQEKLKKEIIGYFNAKFNNSTIAIYFYSLLSEDIGINKTWELLSSGSSKDLEKKEVYIIRAIVDLIESNGFTDFYILVDEFEAVTAGRLTTTEVDRYVTNLRTLIDKERNWCSVFAMTGLALSKLRTASPPLAERISSRLIELKSIGVEDAKLIVTNYLNLAREESLSISPFSDDALEELVKRSSGILRVFLRACFQVLQRACEELGKDKSIDAKYVKKHFETQEE